VSESTMAAFGRKQPLDDAALSGRFTTETGHWATIVLNGRL